MATPEAQAANFNVTTEAELRDAIDDANGNADATDTITLLNDIVISDTTAFPALNNPVTINTGAFTLSGANTATGTTPGTSLSFGSGSLTIIGDLEGGDSAPDAGNIVGGTGVSGNGTTVTLTGGSTITGGDGGDDPGLNPAGRGGVGLNLLNGTLLNDGVITGGAGGISAGNEPNNNSGGTGAVLNGGTGHVNNGIIRGGTTTGVLGSARGLELSNGTLVNNGTIEGGTVTPGAAGNSATNSDGAYLQGNATIINNSAGIITGAEAPGGGRGGDGITLFGANNTIINDGTIAGGTDAGGSGTDTYGIVAFFGASNTTIINSGTIQGDGGGSQANTAISLLGGRSTVELRAGSTIIGDVLASVGSTTDILRLGGAENDSFDVSAIGSSVQYRSFDIFEKTGASTWTITGQGTNQAAPWDIYEGTLVMSAGSDLGNGSVDLIGGTLAGLGTVGSTTAAAGTVISPGIAGVNNGIGTLTIDGDYTGNGGRLAIETVLGGDNSATDLLVVNGGTTGNTLVQVTNLGGPGAQTQEGIKIVDVGGTSAGAFSLLGDAVVNGEQAVIAGAYAYSLFQNGITDPADGDWYLRSIGFSPTATSYESYPGVLLGLIEMPTLQQRVGNVYMPNAGSGTDGFVNPEPTADVPEYTPPANFWTRIEASYGHHEGNSDTGTEYDLARYKVQVGIDGRLVEGDDGILIAGINAQYGHADADLSSDSGDGDNSTDSYGGGLTLSWFGNGGTYVDTQAMAHYLETDLSSDLVGDLVDNNEGWGYGLSLEVGRKLALDDAWSVTPQAQLAYTSVDFDDFTDPFGADVSLENGESLKGRIGLALNYDSFEEGESRGHVYTIANLTYEFLGEQSVDVAGVDVEFEPEEFGGELGLGGTYEWAQGKYAIHGEALGQTSFEGSYGVKGTAGFSTKF